MSDVKHGMSTREYDALVATHGEDYADLVEAFDALQERATRDAIKIDELRRDKNRMRVLSDSEAKRSADEFRRLLGGGLLLLDRLRQELRAAERMATAEVERLQARIAGLEKTDGLGYDDGYDEGYIVGIDTGRESGEWPEDAVKLRDSSLILAAVARLAFEKLSPEDFPLAYYHKARHAALIVERIIEKDAKETGDE
jgi:hypothetical protein